jgi:hypothetical protein
MKIVAKIKSLAALAVLTLASIAGATDSNPTKLLYVRAMSDDNRVFIEMKVSNLGTTVFYFVPTGTNGKELSAVALAAITSGRSVIVESGSCGTSCTWGQPLKSLKILGD